MEFLDIIAAEDLFEKFKEEYREKSMPVFLYGKGAGLAEYIRLMRKTNIPIECIVDGKKTDEVYETYMEVEVKTPEQVFDEYFNGYIVISAPRHRKAIIKEINEKVQDRFSIKCFDATLDLAQCNSGGVRKKYYIENKEEIESLYDILADDRSKECLIQILLGSVSNNLDHYAKVGETSQYFPDFIKERMGKEEVYVDLGAFTGDSIEDFLEAVNGKYSKIIAFEPDKENFCELKEKLSKEEVDCLPYGVGNTNSEIYFYHENHGTDTSAKVVKTKAEANMQIRVVRLDDVISEKVTYIKMDIEGMELEALKGGKELIEKYRPKLAISAYHKKEDLIDIPQFILDLNLGYKLYLRHLWECAGTDTVLFAVADEK